MKAISEEIESAKLIDGKLQVERELVDRWKTIAREQEKLNQRLIDRSRFLARLTQVDGALVMTERLQVLGFGAVIQDLSQTRPTVRSCRDERCQAFVELKRESYGTRHRSAIELCERMDCIPFSFNRGCNSPQVKEEEEPHGFSFGTT